MKIKKFSGKLVADWLPERKPNSHKGDFGHVLIVAGSRGMSGASVLCASGALRGGAGLVTVAVPESQQSIVAKKVRPEAMTLGLPETDKGTISSKAVSVLMDFIIRRRITSIALGPGLSRTPETVKFLRKFLLFQSSSKIPLHPPLQKGERGELSKGVRGIVLDADGFLACAPANKKDFFLRQLELPLIVTPHPGELANFLGRTTEQIQKDRIQSARQFAKLYSLVCVLKGHQTVVTDGNQVYLNPTGNPGMATGGSGDVLTGLIAALIAQMRVIPLSISPFVRGRDVGVVPPLVKGERWGFDPASSIQHPLSCLLPASCIGVYIHGFAGDLAKKEKGEISLLAGDIAEKIPDAFRIILRT